MSKTHWDSGDLSRAASIPDKAALGFVEDRIGTKKNDLDAWLFELLLRVGTARKAGSP